MINLNIVVNGQAKIDSERQADDRFVGDYEPIEFVKTDYDEIHLVDTDSMKDKLIEKVVAIKDIDAYLITATTTVFAGERQVNYISQELSLRGLNFFGKEIDLTEYHNQYLQDKGYEITVDDILELGEYMPEYGESTILRFKDDEDNFHILTVNKFQQLSKITVKQSARQVNSNSSIQSAF